MIGDEKERRRCWAAIASMISSLPCPRLTANTPERPSM
jgi:hypothetical protein